MPQYDATDSDSKGGYLMKFHIEVSFLHKKAETKKLEAKDGYTAISKVLNGLDSLEKDNIKGTKITYMN